MSSSLIIPDDFRSNDPDKVAELLGQLYSFNDAAVYAAKWIQGWTESIEESRKVHQENVHQIEALIKHEQCLKAVLNSHESLTEMGVSSIPTCSYTLKENVERMADIIDKKRKENEISIKKNEDSLAALTFAIKIRESLEKAVAFERRSLPTEADEPVFLAAKRLTKIKFIMGVGLNDMLMCSTNAKNDNYTAGSSSQDQELYTPIYQPNNREEITQVAPNHLRVQYSYDIVGHKIVVSPLVMVLHPNRADFCRLVYFPPKREENPELYNPPYSPILLPVSAKVDVIIKLSDCEITRYGLVFTDQKLGFSMQQSNALKAPSMRNAMNMLR